MTRIILHSVSMLCRTRKASTQHAHLWPPTRPVIAEPRERKDSMIMAIGGKLLMGRSTCTMGTCKASSALERLVESCRLPPVRSGRLQGVCQVTGGLSFTVVRTQSDYICS